MHKLHDTYLKIKSIIGDDIEPYESVRLVESYRRYFKPDNVKLILLAESHVYTSEADRKIKIPSLRLLPDYPEEYARFVYCLGYGERDLTKNKKHPRDGTPQFWKIFYSCCNKVESYKDFNPILSITPHKTRIENKISILKRLKDNGIWLVDASIVALYKNGNKCRYIDQVIYESWQCYTRDVVFSEKPKRVICIGKGVYKVVKPDLEQHLSGKYDVIPQPNAFLTSGEHLANFMRYSKICHEAIND